MCKSEECGASKHQDQIITVSAAAENGLDCSREGVSSNHQHIFHIHRLCGPPDRGRRRPSKVSSRGAPLWGKIGFRTQKLALRDWTISFIPRGADFFRGTWGRYLGLRRCVYRCSEQHPAPTSTCPCEYVARRPPHRRWVQETQPHTYGCAERILTAEFQLNAVCRMGGSAQSTKAPPWCVGRYGL